MKYKYIFLTILIPFTIVGYDDSAIKRIKELEEIEFQKLSELSDLGKMISERDEFHLYFNDKCREIFHASKMKKAAYVEAKNNISLSSEQIKQIGDSISGSAKNFLYRLGYEDHEKDAEEFLLKELYNSEDPDSGLTFESLKFAYLRECIEQNFLKMLVKRYVECYLQLRKIRNELNDLKR